jgi:exodeoxyribonuclease-5
VDAASDWVAAGAPGGVFRLFGYAGTGKTTVAQHIRVPDGKAILYGAYTGKAASVLSGKGCPATTLHSLIYIPRNKSRDRLEALERQWDEMPEEQRGKRAGRRLAREISAERVNVNRPGFQLNLESELGADHVGALVVDEVSMVDKQMAEDLLSFGKPLVVLGDPAQLPPVGGEGALTNVEPDRLLTEVLRHDGGRGSILERATAIRGGERIPRDAYDRPTRAQARAADVILCGTNKTRWSRIRQIRAMEGRGEAVEPGDRIICLANNRDLGVFNGQTFRAVRVISYDGDTAMYLEVEDDTSGERRVVRAAAAPFTGPEGEKWAREFLWRDRSLGFFTFGHCLTVHKSQGSEWPRVIVIDESRVFRSDRHRWLYTAVTRAREEVLVMRG